MTPTALLRAIGVAELGAGVGLLIVPSTVSQLLAGQPLDPGAPILVARVAGAALVAIALTCWLESISARPGWPVSLLSGLLAYNGTVAVVLAHSHFANGIRAPGLWPTVVLHCVFTIALGICLRRHRRRAD